jgi:hypothetical protein
MGLDMYLTRKKYVKNWEHTPERDKHNIKISRNGRSIDEYYVSSEQLANLLDDILYSLKNKDHAESVLPTSKGFFFGSDEYNEDYWQDLQVTADELQELLSSSEALEDEFSYRASW